MKSIYLLPLKLALLCGLCSCFSTVPQAHSRIRTNLISPHVAKILSRCQGVPIPVRSKQIGVLLLSSSTPSEDADSGEPEETNADAAAVPSTEKVVGFRKRIGSYFKSSDKDDGLTFRQRLAKMGLATVLSYGWISNTNAMILVAAAWYVFSAQAKMSPLYPGQWKNFLTVYAGFYVISNFLRPFRVTLAVMVGPYFERLVGWIQRKLRIPKAAAVTITVLMVNLGGTILLMVGGISLASLLSGVPIFPPKP